MPDPMPDGLHPLSRELRRNSLGRIDKVHDKARDEESRYLASIILCHELNRELRRNPRGRIDKAHDKVRDEGNRSGIRYPASGRWSSVGPSPRENHQVV